MKIKFLRSYPKGDKTQFVYTVDGTPEEIAKYKALQGTFLREDDATGKPLYFTSQAVTGDTGTLKFNTKGDGVYVDRSAIAKQNSLVAQYPGKIGDALASQIASEILGGKKPVVATAPAVEVTEEEDETKE
jgi:hypothetical protein